MSDCNFAAEKLIVSLKSITDHKMHFKPNTYGVKCLLLSASVAAAVSLSGCKDEYLYDDEEPSTELLGASIYESLQSDGNFTYFLRLIDDLGYAETLRRTGSKTLFPARDEAFERFFRDNPYGVTCYEQLTAAQKRAIMNSAMVNMAYLSDMLSNVAGTDGAVEGRAVRRFTSASMLDTVARVDNPELFENPRWKRFADKPLYLVSDAPMLVHFTPGQMSTMGMTGEDFSLMLNGKQYTSGDIYVNGIRVVERDRMCKNGYIHVLEDVLLPANSMADAIADASDAKTFSRLLDKFSAPYYDASTDAQVKEFYNGSTPLRPSIGGVDSIFRKRFFNERDCSRGPLGESLSGYGLLYYDPSESTYSQSSSEQDMGTMFVPTDEAMEQFLNGGKGSYLRDAYGSWDNIPTDILAMFLKNHQKRSFSASLPHAWPALTDETSYPISISPANVVRTEITGNGVVYFINTVFPPIDYQGVYGSVLTADNTKVMKWAITDDWNDLTDTQAMRYYMYLRSMENMYNLLVPTDEALARYREPISWARGGSNREIWSFSYDESTNSVRADVYASDAQGNPGEFKRTVTTKSVIRNRMRDILDLHIVVGDNDGGSLSGFIDDGSARFALTKGGGTIAVQGRDAGLATNGGGDFETGQGYASVVTASTGVPARYTSDNGRTFFIDHVLHDASTSVYDQMAAHPEFKAFFDLCRGHDQVFNIFARDEEVEEIFAVKTTTASSSIGNVVNFFNNYRYTIFVPTEDALKQAFASDPKLYTWDEIAADANLATKREKTLYLLRFLRFHFADNSAYISGKSYGPLLYETAARNNYDKFHKISVESDGAGMTVRGVDVTAGNEAHVITSSGLYNLMARDIIVDNTDVSRANNITASSRAVIHLVDKALRFE